MRKPNWTTLKMKYNKSQLAWISYDFSNSSYDLIIGSALFPLFFKQVLWPESATTDLAWSIAISLPLIIVGISSPFIGAFLDNKNKKKEFFVFSCIMTGVLTMLLGFVSVESWLLLVIIFSFSLMFFKFSQFSYNAFLPSQKTGKGTALLSGVGWGLGYLGGISSIALAFYFIKGKSLPGDFLSYQHAFLAVSAFFLFFSLPSIFFLKANKHSAGNKNDSSTSISSVINTIKNWRNNKKIFKFLIAFYLINDGLTTIVFFSSLFASGTLKMSTNQVMLGFLISLIVAVPATIILSRLSEKIGYMKMLYWNIFLWICIAISFLIVKTPMHLFILAAFIGLVIGTTPSLARAILANMISRNKSVESAEIYGFHTMASRVSAVVGPLLFGAVSTVTHSQTLALSSLTIFFLAGLLILRRVNYSEVS